MILEVFLAFLVIPAIGFLGLVLWIAYLHHRYSHIPGPKRKSFFLGNIPDFSKDRTMPFAELGHKWFDEYGPVVCVWFAVVPMIVCRDPSIIKEILITKDFPKAKMIFSQLRYMIKVRSLGDGLVTQLDHQAWKKQRTVVNPAFHRSYLKTLVPNYNRSTNILIGKLKTMADGVTVINLVTEFHRVALDVIAKAAFGLNLNTILDDKDVLKNACDKVLGGFQFKMRNPLYKVDFRTFAEQKELDDGVQLVRDYGARCVAERKKMLSEGKQLPNDIMSMVVKEAAIDGSLTEEQLIDEFVTFIVAGQDTTSNMLSFLVFALLENPYIPERLVAEVEEVLHEREEVDFEDLGKLKLMGQCMKETLRLYPPAAVLDRECTHAVEYAGYHIPKGTIVGAAIYSVQRDPKLWPNPDVFNPDRWDKESADNPGIVNGFMPFSAGSRNCIGRYFAEFEAKVVLARLLQTFEMSLAPGAKFAVGQSGTLKPKYGLPVLLSKRQK